MAQVINHFDLDDERLAAIAEGMNSYDVGVEGGAEWPNNILSRRTVVYGSGQIARDGAPVRHAVDADELALCRRLSSEIAGMMANVDVGMGSEAGDPFQGFFIAGNVGDPKPTLIDEALIRSRFGGVVFPLATISVEPMAEAGVWWDEVQADGAESKPTYFDPWRAMIRWFQGRPEFVASAFIRIGDANALWDLPRESWPEGTEVTGCVLPRLALGLTRGGSLAGLFGHVVQT